MSLFFVCNHDQIVFTFSFEEDGCWRFSRLSSFQKNKGLERFLLLYRTSQPEGWLVLDQTASKGDVIGQPGKELQDSQHRGQPPLGPWYLWGTPFVLMDSQPRHPPLVIDPPFPIEVPFATVHYSEEGSVARLEVKMHSSPIVDDILEQVLSRLAGVIRNLAQRPEMVLFIRSDARNSAVPAVRHVKRFLGFVQENGSEFVLVGRGHAIVLNAKGILGSTLLAILRLVQKLFPAPWPESTVSSMEAAEDFLTDLARAEVPSPPALTAEAPFEAELAVQEAPPRTLAVREAAAEPAAPCCSRPHEEAERDASAGRGGREAPVVADEFRAEPLPLLAVPMPLAGAVQADTPDRPGGNCLDPPSWIGPGWNWLCTCEPTPPRLG